MKQYELSNNSGPVQNIVESKPGSVWVSGHSGADGRAVGVVVWRSGVQTLAPAGVDSVVFFSQRCEGCAQVSLSEFYTAQSSQGQAERKSPVLSKNRVKIKSSHWLKTPCTGLSGHFQPMRRPDSKPRPVLALWAAQAQHLNEKSALKEAWLIIVPSHWQKTTWTGIHGSFSQSETNNALFFSQWEGWKKFRSKTSMQICQFRK